MSYSLPLPHPIDIMVRVAGRQFPAHHTILIENSGYFRDVLNNRVKTAIKSKDLDQRIGAELDPSFLITVPPTVSSKSFGILLDFMYSSKLHLDYHNAPEVLQCAQILDMPKAVDMCRHYILGSQPRLEYPTLGYTTSCLARLWHTFPPFFNIPAPTPLLEQLQNPHRLTQPQPSTGVQFIQSQHGLLGMGSSTAPLAPQLMRPIASRPHHCHPCYHHHQLLLSTTTTSANPTQTNHTSTATSLQQTKEFSLAREPQSIAVPMMSTASTSVSIVSETTSNDSEMEVVTKTRSSRSRSPIKPDHNKIVQRTRNQKSETSSSPPPTTPTEKKAILDIAYCDGPVKFQRILNENCDLVMVMQSVDRGLKPKALTEEVPSKSSSKESKKGRNNEKQSKRQMDCQEDEVEGAPCSSSSSSPPSETDTSGNFFCVYCRHTFKSRYCYVKHKRRHLNPLTVENSTSQHGSEIEPKCTMSKAVTTTPVSIDEADVSGSVTKPPLEINSTFYPCKICGCKFPSYYFVHKHRHTCHPGHISEDEEQQEETTIEDEDVSVCT